MKEGPTERVLILLADDDSAMRQMLAGSLRRRGFAVDECEDGKELLDRLETCRSGSAVPDLVVSDVQMPGATGLDVLHWLQRWLRGVPVILITAFGDRRIHRRAQELGAALVIDKPFDLSRLHDDIVRVLGQKASVDPTEI